MQLSFESETNASDRNAYLVEGLLKQMVSIGTPYHIQASVLRIKLQVRGKIKPSYIVDALNYDSELIRIHLVRAQKLPKN